VKASDLVSEKTERMIESTRDVRLELPQRQLRTNRRLTTPKLMMDIAVASADMLPARLRFSVMSIGYNLTLALVGGAAPSDVFPLTQELTHDFKL
jgi:hypothetical protein